MLCGPERARRSAVSGVGGRLRDRRARTGAGEPGLRARIEPKCSAGLAIAPASVLRREDKQKIGAQVE